jgi:hypothetical protein
MAFVTAAFGSATHYEENLLGIKEFASDLDLLTHARTIAQNDGIVSEFDVAMGRTTSHIAGQNPQKRTYGFDSFEGLLEPRIP